MLRAGEEKGGRLVYTARMSWSPTRTLALLLTIAMVGGVSYWAWVGLKAPPVREPTVPIVTTPPGWERADAGTFSLFVPPGTVFHRGTDSGELIGGNFYIHYSVTTQMGPATNEAANPQFVETKTEVDGRRARLFKAELRPEQMQSWLGARGYPYYVGLYVPYRATDEHTMLELDGAAAGDDEREMVEVMLKTVRFARTRT